MSRSFAFILILVTLSLHAQRPLPATKFTALDGSSHTLAELNGHISVVNFWSTWSTWCAPCRDEMPRLQKLADSYAARGVTFLAISLDEPETQSKIPAALRKSDFRIPVWQGATPGTLKELDLGILVPATLIVDEHGAVIGRFEGEARDKDIQSRLDWALNGHAGKQPKIIQKNDW